MRIESRFTVKVAMMTICGFLSPLVRRTMGRSTAAFMIPTHSRCLSGSFFIPPSPTKNIDTRYRRSFRYASNGSTEGKGEGASKKSGSSSRAKPKSKKIKVKEITQENIEKLAAAFDELARKEGFDSSKSYHADDSTFEEYFDDDDFLDDDDIDDDLDEMEIMTKDSKPDKWELDDVLDPNSFVIDDFVNEKVPTRGRGQTIKAPKVSGDEDDDFIDFGDDDDNDMEARIAAARRDLSVGRVTVPSELDEFATKVDLAQLGFRRELNPFGNDETPRKAAFKLITNPMSCPACGSDFQCRNENRPGYLPPEKFSIQTKLSKIEEMQQLKAKAESAEWSPEDEVEFLIQTANGKATNDERSAADIDIDAMAAEMGLDLAALSSKKAICKRCHGLQNFGKVENSLRPGWTNEPTMSQDEFRNLLKPISEKPAVIIALVDLFDFSGSVLRELDGIAGDNPVILAANKIDLLPPKMGKQRAENWVRRELEYMGVRSLANVGGAVRLISCKTGVGVDDMLDKARSLADEMDCDVYVVGAANAGKSTLINKVLGRREEKPVGKVRAGNRNAFKGALTTSPLPGTTLKFIKVDIGDGRSMYDTPGLLVPGTFTQLLTPDELKTVCPKKPVEPVTFRVEAGKCVLVGGLARVEVIGDSQPFMFTFYVANEIKLHPTSASKADEFIEKHAGNMLTPPFEPGQQRMAELGEFESHVLEIEGTGWKEAAADLTLTGLGWVAVTGAGSVKVKVSVPKGIGVAVRPPLMPFDIWEVASRYTGAKAVRKVGKSKSGKKRKGVGRN